MICHTTNHSSTPTTRQKKWKGRDYIVAPLTLIVPGTLNGSQGPLYYPPEELAESASAWNGMPMMIGHPFGPFGEAQSASEPAHANGASGFSKTRSSHAAHCARRGGSTSSS